MEERSSEEKEKADARDKTRVLLAKAGKMQIDFENGVDTSDRAPHEI